VHLVISSESVHANNQNSYESLGNVGRSAGLERKLRAPQLGGASLNWVDDNHPKVTLGGSCKQEER
jgi:hypothetical protein